MNALQWESRIDRLIESIDGYAERIEAAVVAAANVLAKRAEEDAKNNAPWQDRTGDARDGLNAFVERAQNVVTIYLAHGPEINYDIYLETMKGGSLAIIGPTLEALFPIIMDAIRYELGA